MKTISISHEIKQMLNEIGGEKSFNSTVQELLMNVEEVGDLGKSAGNSNMNLSDDVFDKLSKCRLYPTEPYNSVLFRLVQLKREE